MLNNGFLPYNYRPVARTLENLDAKDLQSGNALFIRDYERVSSLLTNAPDFNILGRRI